MDYVTSIFRDGTKIETDLGFGVFSESDLNSCTIFWTKMYAINLAATKTGQFSQIGSLVTSPRIQNIGSNAENVQ